MWYKRFMQREKTTESRFGMDSDAMAGISAALGRWYESSKRDLPWRRTQDPYAIWVSEVMLQQTQVNTVIPYYHRFLDRFPGVVELAAADIGEVYKLWEGLGYYSRARHMHQAAGVMAAETGGKLPTDPDALRGLPGIGPYIGAAVSSIAFGLPFAVVDGNVKRVLARLFLLEPPANNASSIKTFQRVADGLLDQQNPGRHNQAMMELGALICAPNNPRCSKCPLTVHCRAFQDSKTGEYPRRIKRPALTYQHWTSGVIVRKGRILAVQRPETGLLCGLWEFPCIPLKKEDDPLEALVSGLYKIVGIHVASPVRITTVNHTYTHFKLIMDVFCCHFKSGRVRLNGPAAFKWVKPVEITALPLHKAVHKALPAITEYWGDKT